MGTDEHQKIIILLILKQKVVTHLEPEADIVVGAEVHGHGAGCRAGVRVGAPGHWHLQR